MISEDKNRLTTGVDADGNKIGIALWEIYSCLRYYKRDKSGKRNLSLPIQFGDINKWSFNKPIRSNSTEKLTQDDISNRRCGLSAFKATKLIEKSIGFDGSASHTKEDCLAEISEWTYLRPRGLNTYNERFRILDFDGYNHEAIAPDRGWSQIEIDTATINKLKGVTLDINSTGDYAGYNFVVTPKQNNSVVNDGLYTSFGLRFGFATDESINYDSNMEIPIKAVVDLDGAWRLALAIWIPNFGTEGGWGLFASRMSITQYFDENLGSGDNLRNLFPDLATNPFAMQLISDYLAGEGNGYASFDVVPLLVKNLQYTKNSNGVDILRPLKGVSDAYCMPSGTRAIQFVCGTPPMPIWYKIHNVYQNNVQYIDLENTDPDASHTFKYILYVTQNSVTSEIEGSITLGALERQRLRGNPMGAGFGLGIKVIEQDGVSIN